MKLHENCSTQHAQSIFCVSLPREKKIDFFSNPHMYEQKNEFIFDKINNNAHAHAHV